MSSRHHLQVLAIMVCAAVTTTGCMKSFVASPNKEASSFQNASAANPMMRPPGVGGPSYTVAIYPKEGSPEEMRLPVAGAMVVQEALKQAGVVDRMNRMRVALIRTPPNGQGRHKMDINFLNGKKLVTAKSNYAIFPGDRLIVIEDDSTKIDDIVKSATRPFGAALNRPHSHSH